MWYLYCALSTLISFYVLYLYAFRCYEKKKYEQEWKKSSYPHLTYILLAIGACIPILNTIGAVVFLIMPLSCDQEIKIDSWLYRKPKQEEKED